MPIRCPRQRSNQISSPNLQSQTGPQEMSLSHYICRPPMRRHPYRTLATDPKRHYMRLRSIRHKKKRTRRTVRVPSSVAYSNLPRGDHRRWAISPSPQSNGAGNKEARHGIRPRPGRSLDLGLGAEAAGPIARALERESPARRRSGRGFSDRSLGELRRSRPLSAPKQRRTAS